MSILESIKVLRSSIDCALMVNEERQRLAHSQKDETEYLRLSRSAKVLYKLKGKANNMYEIICDLGLKDTDLVTEECAAETEGV